MNEKELQEAVIDLAHLLKWRVAHFRPAMNAKGEWRTAVAGDGKGFPDLVLVRDRVLFVELKSDTGRLTVEQQDWAFALSHAGVEWTLWSPTHWASGTIEHTLRKTAIGAA